MTSPQRCERCKKPFEEDLFWKDGSPRERCCVECSQEEYNEVTMSFILSLLNHYKKKSNR